MLYHARAPFWAGRDFITTNPDSYSSLDHALAYPGAACHFFGQAVMLFFVLSGFCIHYPYAAKARPLQLKPYAIRRFLRIYPPYLAAVLLSVLATFLSFHYWELRNPAAENFWRSILMTQNYPPGTGQIDLNPALWSLPVEMELYLAYPIFYFCLARFGLTTSIGMALVATVLGQAMRYYTHLSFPEADVDWHNFSLYWLTWCGGAWIAEQQARNSLPRCGLGWTVTMIAFLGIAICSDQKVQQSLGFTFWQYAPGERLVWGIFFFLLIAWCLRHLPYPEDNTSRIGKSLNGLGAISYSLYLTHYPFLFICGHALMGRQLDLPDSKYGSFLVPLAFSGLAIVFAMIFYTLVERPCHHWARRLGRNT